MASQHVTFRCGSDSEWQKKKGETYGYYSRWNQQGTTERHGVRISQARGSMKLAQPPEDGSTGTWFTHCDNQFDSNGV